MQLIPAVDVLGGNAVRLAQGDYDQVTRYADDPIEMVQRWADAGADLVHVVDLEGARSGNLNRGLVERLGAVRVPIQFGGGIRTVESAEAALAAGLSRIVVGSVLLGEGATDFVSRLDAGSIVAGVDVRSGRARGSGWSDHGLEADEALQRVLDLGLTTILATGIETDGMMIGPDLALLERFRAMASSCRLIASGGVGTLADFDALVALGADAVVVGRALYEDRFTFEEAVARC
ncbi:MAG: 1-(5-phosphoribosyl)-5-[(5-phosphoribosylamino)methylideneamino] imidazole-4-carboxamide isomerase [Acidimicrobiia bacterium]